MNWNRSSKCANGACVEVATEGGMVYVRDSKLGDASDVLTLTRAEFVAFCAAAVEWGQEPSADG